MEKKYRINKCRDTSLDVVYAVQMWNIWCWVTIKYFKDEDEDFAKREAEELLEKLNEK